MAFDAGIPVGFLTGFKEDCRTFKSYYRQIKGLREVGRARKDFARGPENIIAANGLDDDDDDDENEDEGGFMREE